MKQELIYHNTGASAHLRYLRLRRGCFVLLNDKDMKYRIKIYTYENGRTEYSAQVKISHFFNLINTWVSLSRSGENLFSEWRMQSRAEALTAIDMHFSGNHSVKSIQIQYITR